MSPETSENLGLICDSISSDFSGVTVRSIPTPAPEAGQLGVRVEAVSLNFPDYLMVQGGYQHKPPLPFAVGMEWAGIVEEVGEGLDDWKVGDRIAAGGLHTGQYGGCVQRTVLDAANAIRLNPAVDLAEAAGLPACHLTAHVGLKRFGLARAGEKLLVTGATGGVGLATVNVGNVLGLEVIAVTRRKGQEDLLRKIGAQHVIATDGLSGKEFVDQVKEVSGGGVDLVLDNVGGDLFHSCMRTVNFMGRVLVCGFVSGQIPEIKTNYPLIKCIQIIGMRAGEHGRRFPELGNEDRAAMWEAFNTGKYKVVVGERAELTEALELLQSFAEGAITGKAIVHPNGYN